MKRWICPICGGGKLAPERLDKLDVRRWCLGCSDDSGKLVERRCPSVERARASRKQRAAKRRQSKAERARADRLAQETAGGLHVPSVFEQLRRALVKLGYRRLSKKPKLLLRRNERIGYYTGHAWCGRPGRITMTIGDVDAAAVYELVGHELCHLAVGGGHGHGDVFNRALRQLAAAVWDIEIFIDEDGGGYGPTHKLVKLLREKLALDEGGTDRQDGRPVANATEGEKS